MISAIFVVNAAGLKLYSKVYDSNIVVDDLLLVSILSAIQMYAEKAIDENIKSIEFDKMHIIYRTSSKFKEKGVMIVIIADQINTTISLQASHIINLINNRLVDSINVLEVGHFNKEMKMNFSELEKEIDEIINLSEENLQHIQKESYVLLLEKLLNKIAKRVPQKTLLIDPAIMIDNKKNFCVDPTITIEEAEKIKNKLRNSITKLYGSKIFEETLREIS